MIYHCLVLALVLPLSFAHAQSWVMDQILTGSTQTLDENNINYNPEQLEQIYHRKINLNTAKAEDFAGIPGLYQEAIQAILKHREVHGDFLSIFELQSIEVLYPILSQLIPFVYVNSPDISSFSEHPYSQELNLRVHQTLEHQYAYRSPQDSSVYLGSPQQVALRYKYQGHKLSVGFNAEKDAGEMFTKQGFDFYSGHLLYRGEGFLKQIVVGDYHVEFGQGLGIWTSFASTNPQDPFMSKKNPRGIVPYTSLSESGFMRGTALSLGHKILTATVFASSKKEDAKVDSVSGTFTPISNGYHRSLKELQYKHLIDNNIVGFMLTTRLHNLICSGLSTFQQYRTQFTDTTTMLFALSYHWTHKNMIFFGEGAYNDNYKGFAHVHGLLLSLHKTANLALVYRHYSNVFMPIYSAADGNSSGTNEQGLRLNFEYTINKKVRILFSQNISGDVWLKNRTLKPQQQDYLSLQFIHQWSKKSACYLKYKTNRSDDIQQEGNRKINTSTRQYQIQIHLENNEHKYIQTETRFSYAHNINSKSSAYLMYQDFRVAFHRRISLTSRLAVFDVQNGDLNLYAYESGVAYGSGTYLYNHRGLRGMLFVNIHLFKSMKMQIKWAQTRYTDINTIGSDGDLILGNRKTDLNLALQYRF